VGIESKPMAGVGRSVAGCVALLTLFALFAPPAGAARPNVVVVVTDDQTLESFKPEVMPTTLRAVAGRGTTFSEGIVASPQCCPSRGAYLTGQYPHNNELTSNQPGYRLLAEKRNVLPSWLQRAGYRTIHIGKFINGYTRLYGTRPAPGWSHWRTLIRTDYQQPHWSIDGRFRADHSGYLTTTIGRMASRTVRRAARERRPFYLQVDHLAPHVGSRQEQSRCERGPIPHPDDEELFSDATAPRTPAVDEEDVSDKPEFIRRNDPLTPRQLAAADRHYGCALASLRAVDRSVADLLEALRRAGELWRTMIVFTSDNGFSYAERRMPLSKGLPYEEHLRVPFVIRPPRSFPNRSRSGRTVRAPVANIDLAPTILALARARPCGRGPASCRRMDGRSLLPLLRGRDPDWSGRRAIRTGFSINTGAYKLSCEWVGLRTPSRMLVRHVSLPEPGGTACREADEYEHYDLGSDPWQLTGDRPIPPNLKRRLDRLRRCSGIRGRDGFVAGKPFCE
jgi:N-acetylglucosamine-6-sulfatase